MQAAQDRLVQTEKLASLGQLTAGIAHEIKNPLNFVNNFASLSAEMTDELNDMFPIDLVTGTVVKKRWPQSLETGAAGGCAKHSWRIPVEEHCPEVHYPNFSSDDRPRKRSPSARYANPASRCAGLAATIVAATPQRSARTAGPVCSACGDIRRSDERWSVQCFSADNRS